MPNSKIGCLIVLVDYDYQTLIRMPKLANINILLLLLIWDHIPYNFYDNRIVNQEIEQD